CPAPHLALHPFPTRRSSDLSRPAPPLVAFFAASLSRTMLAMALSVRTFNTSIFWLNSRLRSQFGLLGWSLKRSIPLSLCSSSVRSEEHTSELQSRSDLVCRL